MSYNVSRLDFIVILLLFLLFFVFFVLDSVVRGFAQIYCPQCFLLNLNVNRIELNRIFGIIGTNSVRQRNNTKRIQIKIVTFLSL